MTIKTYDLFDPLCKFIIKHGKRAHINKVAQTKIKERSEQFFREQTNHYSERVQEIQ